MFRSDWPWYIDYDSYGIWWHRTLTYIGTITTINDTVKQNISSKSKSDFEEWLNENNYTWTYESTFSGNGENEILNSNQYRVVLRTGIQYICGTIQYDYHFWYQTSDGTWSNKHGESSEIHLPSGTAPFSLVSSGWSLDYTIGDVHYTYTDFYDGTVYSCIITFD